MDQNKNRVTNLGKFVMESSQAAASPMEQQPMLSLPPSVHHYGEQPSQMVYPSVVQPTPNQMYSPHASPAPNLPPDVPLTITAMSMTPGVHIGSGMSTAGTKPSVRTVLLAFIRQMTPRPVFVLPIIVLLLSGVGVGFVLTHAAHPTTIAQKPVITTPVVKEPTPTQTKPTPTPTNTPAVTHTPTPSKTPPTTPTATMPSPPSSLPVVAGKDTSYNLGVLVIKYFPLTSNGQNINIAVTGDVGNPYTTIRQKTIDMTNNMLNLLPKATQYLGYKYGADPPALTYHMVGTIEHTTAVPINSTLHAGQPTYPDYPGIVTNNDVCNYVDNQGVHEVWLWAYQGPSKPGTNYPYLDIAESKMASVYGNISNSQWNDLPKCKHTYILYTFNYGRGTAEAIHSWGHQIEYELRAVDNTLFGLFQGPNYPATLGVTGRCGSVHNPPNARFEYDWDNPTPHASDCEDWAPDGMGTLTSIGCAVWGCDDVSDANNAQLNWQIWMWQNLPGRNNTKTYQGKQLRNWWDVHGNFDAVMGGSKRLTL